MPPKSHNIHGWSVLQQWKGKHTVWKWDMVWKRRPTKQGHMSTGKSTVKPSRQTIHSNRRSESHTHLLATKNNNGLKIHHQRSNDAPKKLGGHRMDRRKERCHLQSSCGNPKTKDGNHIVPMGKRAQWR